MERRAIVRRHSASLSEEARERKRVRVQASNKAYQEKHGAELAAKRRVENPKTNNYCLKPIVCRGCDRQVVRTSNRQTRCSECARVQHAARERARRAAASPQEQQRKREYRLRYRNENKEIIAAAGHRRAARLRRDAKAAERCRILHRKAWARRVATETPEQAVKRRASRRRFARRRYLADPIRWRMSASIRRALKGQKLGVKWETLLGYNSADLRQHIERQFTKGMTWENMSEWHIDHIVPVAAFTYSTADDPAFQACWAITNLRPLWAKENFSKRDKRLFLL